MGQGSSASVPKSAWHQWGKRQVSVSPKVPGTDGSRVKCQVSVSPKVPGTDGDDTDGDDTNGDLVIDKRLRKGALTLGCRFVQNCAKKNEYYRLDYMPPKKR